MMSKIHIRMGDVEVEYEGSEEFLRDELPKLLSGVLELYRAETKSPLKGKGTDTPDTRPKPSNNGYSKLGTTKTIAAKLAVKSGSDLAIAAAARLSLGLDKETFSRAELLSEMKAATSYYKSSYNNNLSKTIQSLVSADRIRELSTDAYALSATELQDLETKLAS